MLLTGLGLSLLFLIFLSEYISDFANEHTYLLLSATGDDVVMAPDFFVAAGLRKGRSLYII